MFQIINSVSDLSSMTEAEKDELLVKFSKKHHYLVDSVINLQRENEKLLNEDKRFREKFIVFGNQ